MLPFLKSARRARKLRMSMTLIMQTRREPLRCGFVSALTLAELSAAHFERNKWSFKDEAEYKNRCYWHIHTVNGA